MRHRRYRVMLPLLLGCVSGLLMIWDLHNSRAIDSMGLADIGPPFWPYEASWIAFLTINAPAYILSAPVFFVLDLQTAPARYPLLFPVAVIWWWWLGRRIDLGLLPSRSHRRRWWMGATLLVVALGLYCIGLAIVLEDARWWSHWGGQGFGMRLLRTGGATVWCFLIAVTLPVAAVQALRSERHA